MDGGKYMIFRMNDLFFGAEIRYATSIERMQEITAVPGTEKYIKGLISLRGEIIPVIDLKERLSLEKSAEAEDERILIIRMDDIQAGLIIDEAIEVREIDSSEINSAPAIVRSFDKDFMHGVVQTEEQLIILLNLAAILDLEENEEKTAANG